MVILSLFLPGKIHVFREGLISIECQEFAVIWRDISGSAPAKIIILPYDAFCFRRESKHDDAGGAVFHLVHEGNLRVLGLSFFSEEMVDFITCIGVDFEFSD